MKHISKLAALLLALAMTLSLAGCGGSTNSRPARRSLPSRNLTAGRRIL